MRSWLIGVAYDPQPIESLLLSRRARRAFHSGRAFRRPRSGGTETENGVSREEGSAIGYEAAREAGHRTTKGGHRALDNICDTVATLAIGVLERLCDGRARPYSARRRNHCAGGRPHSEAKVLVRVADPETYVNKSLS